MGYVIAHWSFPYAWHARPQKCNSVYQQHGPQEMWLVHTAFSDFSPSARWGLRPLVSPVNTLHVSAVLVPPHQLQLYLDCTPPPLKGGQALDEQPGGICQRTKTKSPYPGLYRAAACRARHSACPHSSPETQLWVSVFTTSNSTDTSARMCKCSLWRGAHA